MIANERSETVATGLSEASRLRRAVRGAVVAAISLLTVSAVAAPAEAYYYRSDNHVAANYVPYFAYRYEPVAHTGSGSGQPAVRADGHGDWGWHGEWR
jgi:hypothetical protein